MKITWETLKTCQSDEKSLLIHLFLTYTRSGAVGGHKKKRGLGISAESQATIMSEIINTSMKSSSIIRRNHDEVIQISETDHQNMAKPTDESVTPKTIRKKNNPKLHPIPIEDFAKKHGVKVSTVLGWIRKEKITSAYQDKEKCWWVDANEPVIDRRAGRTVKERSDGSGRKNVRFKKGGDIKELHKYIKERALVTDNVRPFIRTYEEIKYYENHSYREVKWNIGSALIIDINPDYYCKSLGKTNRQIIADGGSPVVPRNEEYKYHLHHIGQKKESPLAIIPEYDHNSKEFYSAFHLGKAASVNLHDKEFEKQKREFWNAYIEQYDQYGSFSKIPFLNSKHKRKERAQK